MREGWEIKTILELCEHKSQIVGGPFGSNLKVSDYKECGIPILRLQNIGKGHFIDKDIKYVSDEKAEELAYHSFESGDIILAKLGIPIGKTCIVPNDFKYGIVVADVVRIRPNKEAINYDFLTYFLNSDNSVNQLSKDIKGATRPRVNIAEVRNLKLGVPPLLEQKRIVSILDRAFEAIDKAKTNAEQNLINAKELFESYLQGVFDPSTRSGQGNKGDDWVEITLKEITSKIGSGATPRGGKASYKEEGISLVRSMNVHDFDFREKNLAFIDDKQATALSNVELQEDDVLLNITGASIARCCIIPKQYLPARVNQHVSIIRAKQNLVLPLFLASLLTSKFYKDQILNTGEQGATRQAITKVQLENFKIVMSKSIDVQKQIVQKLDALSTETKKLETVYQQKLDDFEELKKSILQKAFNGEL